MSETIHSKVALDENHTAKTMIDEGDTEIFVLLEADVGGFSWCRTLSITAAEGLIGLLQQGIAAVRANADRTTVTAPAPVQATEPGPEF